MFEKYYLLEKEGHMVSALYLSFMPSLAWTGSYHTFGYIIFFFFRVQNLAQLLRILKCIVENTISTRLPLTDLSLLLKGPRLIAVARIRGLLAAQWHIIALMVIAS